MVGAGLLAGLIVSITMQHLLAHLFAGIDTNLLASFAIAAAGLLTAAALAVALPARRSASVDPVIALRAE
jgi:ABC-type antimicrobial peptide transport system permease subunit